MVGHDAEFLLPLQHARALFVPTVVKGTSVAIGIGLLNLMG